MISMMMRRATDCTACLEQGHGAEFAQQNLQIKCLKLLPFVLGYLLVLVLEGLQRGIIQACEPNIRVGLEI